MSVDPFQFVKGVRNGLKKLSETLGQAKNQNLREMGKRLSEIGTKMSEKFDVKKKRGKKDEDQSRR